MTRLAAVQGSKWPSAVPDVSLLQLLGRRLFYSDIIDGETRYNEINDEFLKVLPRASKRPRSWTAKQIHHTILTTFQLSANAYSLNQLRYDLRKLKGHGLLQRDGSRYTYPPKASK